MSHFYVFYPHGLQLVEQLIYALRSLRVHALPDPTLGDSDWKGLIILNTEGAMFPKWRRHFKQAERIFAMNRDAPETHEFLLELNSATVGLLKEDKEAVRIIQHWERWNWLEAAETLKSKCGIRMNGTPLREPFSEQEQDALEEYMQAAGAIVRRVQEEESASAAERFEQRLRERIKADQKFFFTLGRLQA